ncbi:MAG: flagellar biosynthesis anti-sigma factor FlgM [Nitrospirae bacterium]|nr:flagellar biosynthesis anti-sigma factor FlgM [Nitrospirota bacterium]
MRIPGHDPYRLGDTSLPGVKGKQKEAPAQRPGGEGEASPDRIDLSDQAKDIGELRQSVAALPDVRSERVAAITAKLADGTYTVRSAQIADKLIRAALFDRLL